MNITAFDTFTVGVKCVENHATVSLLASKFDL